jgi:hypothetical protein
MQQSLLEATHEPNVEPVAHDRTCNDVAKVACDRASDHWLMTSAGEVLSGARR